MPPCLAVVYSNHDSTKMLFRFSSNDITVNNLYSLVRERYGCYDIVLTYCDWWEAAQAILSNDVSYIILL